LDLYLSKHHGAAGLLAARAAMTLGSLGRSALWLGRSLSGAQHSDALERARRYWALAARHASLGGTSANR
jgi:hypothetical protein